MADKVAFLLMIAVFWAAGLYATAVVVVYSFDRVLGGSMELPVVAVVALAVIAAYGIADTFELVARTRNTSQSSDVPSPEGMLR